jgi:hypothetical protein
MADFWIRLGYAIPLNVMIPLVGGVPTALPPGIQGNHAQGVYLIRNYRGGAPENRYLGITADYQHRFASRQAACFDLGTRRAELNNVDAFLGRIFFRNAGAVGWTQIVGYGGGVGITLDTRPYDFEHLFIKATQRIFPFHTITNTLKTGPLQNTHGANALNICMSWSGGTWGGPGHSQITVAVAAGAFV